MLLKPPPDEKLVTAVSGSPTELPDGSVVAPT
jgi:hypothetical protein